MTQHDLTTANLSRPAVLLSYPFFCPAMWRLAGVWVSLSSPLTFCLTALCTPPSCKLGAVLRSLRHLPLFRQAGLEASLWCCHCAHSGTDKSIPELCTSCQLTCWTFRLTVRPWRAWLAVLVSLVYPTLRRTASIRLPIAQRTEWEVCWMTLSDCVMSFTVFDTIE